jgi:2-polyprenyl-3-methyl-5-hydroxy-6-metoxy-1,4-benzoquinol methylase
VTVRGMPAPEIYVPSHYWEDRARRFASQGAGLAAVCSYGMPEFYNRVIDACQRLALEPWFDIAPGVRVLDVGCGVGRWSTALALRGARVTGMDLSPTMIHEARRRANVLGVGGRCRFLVQDLAQLDAGERFDFVLGVTVLQHILDPDAFRAAVRRMAAHLAPGGRMVLLEAAPSRLAKQCNTTIFHARQRNEYLDLFAECGLELHALRGVDPAPFKIWLLPHIRKLPPLLSLPAIGLVTALSAPIDLLCGRMAVQRSWHAVFVLQHAKRGHHVR